jgi:AcrR family transcriptional regulator
VELPFAQPSGPIAVERADAARNRERILTVATELVGERGIDHVSMQEIARGAGVGAGTIYRRFGDRAGLAMALLDAETIAFQEAVVRGCPPLGPGAPADERLRAFGRRYIELVSRHADLFLAASGLEARDGGGGPTSFWLTHLAVLLRQACPEQDAELLARMFLAAFGPAEILLWTERLGWPISRVHGGWVAMVDALATTS